MSKNANELLISLGIDTSGFDKTLKNVTKQTKVLEGNFKESAKALALSENAFEDLGKTLKAGEDLISSYGKQLDALNEEYTKGQSKLERYAKQQKELPNDIEQARAKLEEVAKTLGKTSEEYTKQEERVKALEKKYNDLPNKIANTINVMQKLELNITQTNNKIKETEKTLEDLGDTTSVNKLSDALSNLSFDGFGDFTSEIDGLSGGLDLLSLGVKGCGLALAGMITNSAIQSAKDYDKAIFDLRTGLGQTKEEAEKTAESLSDMATEGYEIDSLTDAYSTLSKVFKDMSENELKTLSKDISLLNDMGYDTDEVIKVLAKTTEAWGISGREALGLIVKGEQEGLNLSDDWLDTLGEYSPILAGMGFSATDFFNLMVQGFDETKSSSDQLADVFKEIGLKFTEGSDGLRDAFEEIGLNFDLLKQEVDNGTMTMPQAFSRITQALDGVENATDRNRLAQELLSGAFEYTGTFAVDSNNKVINSTQDLEGAVQDLNNAYDESYLKTQRELDGEWNKLKQTIGSAVLPILTEVTRVFNVIFQSVGIGVSNVVTNVQIMANQLKSFFLEIQIGLMETFVNNPILENIFPGMESKLEEVRIKHEETINYIQNKEALLVENQKNLDAIYKSSKEETFESLKNTASTKTKEMSDSMAINTKAGTDSVTENINNMNTAVSNGLGALGNIALTETGEIPKATQENLNKSISSIKNSATGLQDAMRHSFVSISLIAKNQFANMNNVARTELVNLSNIIKNQSTNLYSSARENFISMANVFRTQATNMTSIARNQFTSINNIGTNQFIKLRNNITSQMISARKVVTTQWNSIRNTLSRGIVGKVTVSRVTTNQNTRAAAAPANASLIDNINSIAKINLNNMAYQARAYQPEQIISSNRNSNSNTQESKDNKRLGALENKFDSLMDMMLEVINTSNKDIITYVNVDGRQIARAVAPYSNEIDKYNTRNPRFSF